MATYTSSDGDHTPSGTTPEEIIDLAAQGAGIYYVAIDLAPMQAGDDVEIGAEVTAGASQNRLVQSQAFSDDVGLIAAELTLVSDGSDTCNVIFTQSAGTPRTFNYRVLRIS